VAGYENIYVDCPYCGKANIFNRISDLDNGIPISISYNVECQICKQKFNTSGDRIPIAEFRWFIDELPIYIKQKQYRLYILNLCQGVECFFSQAIINKLIDRNPDLRNDTGCVDLEKYNKARKDIYKKTVYDLCGKRSKKKTFKNATFKDLRTIFLRLFEDERKNDNGNLRKLKEDRRKKSFQEIKNTKINTMRNNIVHKQAYRPSLQEVKNFDSLIDALYYLRNYLDIKKSIF